MTELLLQHGADIHARDNLVNTPAHIAAARGSIDSMRVLIAYGIDFNTSGHLGQTILHRAIEGRNGMLKYLLGEAGGRKIVHVRDNNGRTPLDYAVRSEAWEAVNWLAECGANAEKREESRN